MMSNMDDDNIQKKLITIISSVYSLVIASDFRRPVELIYPKMAVNYLKTVEYPMDLGTLLLHCMNGSATVNSIREGLKLVFANSISYNSSSPMMVSISKHLQVFASNLFEEILMIPFYGVYSDSSNNSSNGNNNKICSSDSSDGIHNNLNDRNNDNTSSIDEIVDGYEINFKFDIDIIKKRFKRLIFIKEVHLKEKEVKMIRSLILSIRIKIPYELSKEIEHIMITLGNYLLQYQLGKDISYISFESLFLSLIQSATIKHTLTDMDIKNNLDSTSNHNDIQNSNINGKSKVNYDNSIANGKNDCDPIAFFGLLKGVTLKEEVINSDRIIDTKTTAATMSKATAASITLENNQQQSEILAIPSTEKVTDTDGGSNMNVLTYSSDVTAVPILETENISIIKPNLLQAQQHTGPIQNIPPMDSNTSKSNCTKNVYKTSSILRNAPNFYNSTMLYLKALEDALGEVLVHIGDGNICKFMYEHMYLYICI